MQEALDPESVRRVMAHYYEVMRTTVERHDGSVEKFVGDAVVAVSAVFGTPVVREDDALRAVRCAGAMTTALHQLNDELERTWGVRLAMRTGVNTGELVISGEGIMVADTMNTAARLEPSAAQGEVLIGEPTWRVVRRAVGAAASSRSSWRARLASTYLNLGRAAAVMSGVRRAVGARRHHALAREPQLRRRIP
jgi:class 3 adenylate cyclase